MTEPKFAVGQRVRYRLDDYPLHGQTTAGDATVQDMRYQRSKGILSYRYTIKPDGVTGLPYGTWYVKEYELEALP